MKPPLVSIVTPCYNGIETLGDCYLDVLAQSYRHWQWIVADDGSSDGSIELLEGWQNDQIKVVSMAKRCGGPAGPRNLAIAHAKGEYIALLDQDDRWQADKLEQQMIFCRQHPEVALVCGNLKVIGDQAHKRKHVVINQQGKTYFPSAEEIFSANPFLASTALFSREICLQVGGFDENPFAIGCDEWDLWIRIALSHRVVYLDQVLGSYRWHEHNLSRQIDNRQSIDYIRAKYKSQIKVEVFRAVVARDSYIKAKRALLCGDRSGFREQLKKAAKGRIIFLFKGWFYFIQFKLKQLWRLYS